MKQVKFHSLDLRGRVEFDEHLIRWKAHLSKLGFVSLVFLVLYFFSLFVGTNTSNTTNLNISKSFIKIEFSRQKA